MVNSTEWSAAFRVLEDGAGQTRAKGDIHQAHQSSGLHWEGILRVTPRPGGERVTGSDCTATSCGSPRKQMPEKSPSST